MWTNLKASTYEICTILNDHYQHTIDDISTWKEYYVPVRVLVIDDDTDTVDVFSEFLELKGLEVVGTGHDGKEAVEAYEKFKPDIVLMDVMMPVYDGFYAIDHIRKMDPKSKIIMVTADLSVKTKERLREMNVSGVIFKPYDIDRVLDVIHSIEGGQTVFLSI